MFFSGCESSSLSIVTETKRDKDKEDSGLKCEIDFEPGESFEALDQDSNSVFRSVDEPSVVVEPSTQITNKKKSGFGLSDLSFEELKLEVRMMPAVVTRTKGAGGSGERARSSSEGGVGSMTEQKEIVGMTGRKTVSKKSTMRQQFSLNDELLSR